jgi:hypothetical protein
MATVNKERQTIQPFMDWIIDTKGKVGLGDLYDYMDEYLAYLKKGREEIEKNNDYYKKKTI